MAHHEVCSHLFIEYKVKSINGYFSLKLGNNDKSKRSITPFLLSSSDEEDNNCKSLCKNPSLKSTKSINSISKSINNYNPNTSTKGVKSICKNSTSQTTISQNSSSISKESCNYNNKINNYNSVYSDKFQLLCAVSTSLLNKNACNTAKVASVDPVNVLNPVMTKQQFYDLKQFIHTQNKVVLDYISLLENENKYLRQKIQALSLDMSSTSNHQDNNLSPNEEPNYYLIDSQNTLFIPSNTTFE